MIRASFTNLQLSDEVWCVGVREQVEVLSELDQEIAQASMKHQAELARRQALDLARTVLAGLSCTLKTEP